jgi:hypothetical protein
MGFLTLNRDVYEIGVTQKLHVIIKQAVEADKVVRRRGSHIF